MKKNVMSNLAINLMICIGIFGMISCSATEEGGSNEGGNTKPPHVVTLINDLIGSYKPINGSTVSILGQDIVLDNSTVIESKLSNNKYIFNINNLSGSTIQKLEFTEDKVIYLGASKITQEFVYKTPDSATLMNVYVKFDSGEGNAFLDLSFDTTSKTLLIQGIEIATKL